MLWSSIDSSIPTSCSNHLTKSATWNLCSSTWQLYILWTMLLTKVLIIQRTLCYIAFKYIIIKFNYKPFRTTGFENVDTIKPELKTSNCWQWNTISTSCSFYSLMILYSYCKEQFSLWIIKFCTLLPPLIYQRIWGGNELYYYSLRSGFSRMFEANRNEINWGFRWNGNFELGLIWLLLCFRGSHWVVTIGFGHLDMNLPWSYGDR